MSVMEDESMDCPDLNTAPKGKKKVDDFDKLDMDFNLDGGFNKISSSKLNTSDLDFSSSPKMNQDSSKEIVSHRAGCKGSKIDLAQGICILDCTSKGETCGNCKLPSDPRCQEKIMIKSLPEKTMSTEPYAKHKTHGMHGEPVGAVDSNGVTVLEGKNDECPQITKVNTITSGKEDVNDKMLIGDGPHHEDSSFKNSSPSLDIGSSGSSDVLTEDDEPAKGELDIGDTLATLVLRKTPYHIKSNKENQSSSLKFPLSTQIRTGGDFLSSWKSMSVMEDENMDLRFNTAPISKKKIDDFDFDKQNMDFNLDGDFNKISSSEMGTSDLDFSSSPEKNQDSSKEVVYHRAGCRGSKVDLAQGISTLDGESETVSTSKGDTLLGDPENTNRMNDCASKCETCGTLKLPPGSRCQEMMLTKSTEASDQQSHLLKKAMSIEPYATHATSGFPGKLVGRVNSRGNTVLDRKNDGITIASGKDVNDKMLIGDGPDHEDLKNSSPLEISSSGSSNGYRSMSGSGDILTENEETVKGDLDIGDTSATLVLRETVDNIRYKANQNSSSKFPLSTQTSDFIVDKVLLRNVSSARAFHSQISKSTATDTKPKSSLDKGVGTWQQLKAISTEPYAKQKTDDFAVELVGKGGKGTTIFAQIVGKLIYVGVDARAASTDEKMKGYIEDDEACKIFRLNYNLIAAMEGISGHCRDMLLDLHKKIETNEVLNVHQAAEKAKEYIDTWEMDHMGQKFPSSAIITGFGDDESPHIYKVCTHDTIHFFLDGQGLSSGSGMMFALKHFNEYKGTGLPIEKETKKAMIQSLLASALNESITGGWIHLCNVRAYGGEQIYWREVLHGIWKQYDSFADLHSRALLTLWYYQYHTYDPNSYAVDILQYFGDGMLSHHVLAKKRTCIIRIVWFKDNSTTEGVYENVKNTCDAYRGSSPDLSAFTHLGLRIPSEVHELPWSLMFNKPVVFVKPSKHMMKLLVDV